MTQLVLYASTAFLLHGHGLLVVDDAHEGVVVDEWCRGLASLVDAVGLEGVGVGGGGAVKAQVGGLVRVACSKGTRECVTLNCLLSLDLMLYVLL